MKPFHLSFVVPNLQETKNFYMEVFNCSVGRETESWIDILFFGHQVTIHQESEELQAKSIDHFGPVLEKEIWQAVLKSCKSHNIEFVMESVVMKEGTSEESGKFLVSDPAGNILEFKFYNSFEKAVENKSL